jgi:hypothetical protein
VRVPASLFVVLVLASPVAAQAPLCEWTGQPTLTSLRVETTSPVGISLVPLRGRRAVVSLVSIGVFHVQTLDDGAPIVGTTREPIALVVSGMQTFDGIATVASGASVEALRPRRPGLRGDITIDDGVRLERMTIPCAALGLASEVSAVPILGPVAPGPRWLARAHLFRLRSRPEPEAPRIVVRMDDRSLHPFVERDRRDGWVRVEAIFPHASLSGWVLDTDLMRLP